LKNKKEDGKYAYIFKTIQDQSGKGGRFAL
jgi:hypothetical protein